MLYFDEISEELFNDESFKEFAEENELPLLDTNNIDSYEANEILLF